MAALDADFWTLAMLFKASTTELEKVVPQTGLRVLIHDHLSKFISLHKEDYSAASQEPNLGGNAPRLISLDGGFISSEVISSADESLLDDDENQSDTSEVPSNKAL